MIKNLLLLSATIACCLVETIAQPGSLDSDFDADGRLLVSVGQDAGGRSMAKY